MAETARVNGSAGAEWIGAALAEFERPLLRYAQRITRDAERARDVVQETFFRLCREQPADLDGHLAEWLFTVCRNKALDVARKEQRMTTLAQAGVVDRASPECPPDELAESHDSAARILEILDTLPDHQQECIRLKFQGALSYREIAGVTGLSVSNVGYLIHVGLKAIRQQMGVA
ncbi:MAG TPA: sigma-70 family RNA polymerase sigma factor [Planctomycetaceae bacterium]|nr:sigma-70 family RNA polymerase sigma factor [Planctomycetaceae bacterium]